ncbi:MAG: hypothetical protein U0325_13310 [Polyangiales bacterium]
MPPLLHRSVALGLCLTLWGCPSSPPPDAGAARDVIAASDAPVRRNRRLRRRAARNRARAENGAAAPTTEPAGEVYDDDPPEAPQVRRNPESGPTLPEDLGPPPATTFDMTQAQNGPMGLEPRQVSRALDPLLPRFSACAAYATRDDGSGPRGRVNLRMRVRPDGSPAAARVSGGNGGPEFVLCVRRVAAAARFASFGGPDVFVTWGFDVDG